MSNLIKLIVASAVLSAGHAAASTFINDAVICANCSTSSSFDEAARAHAGTTFNGERTYLVISALDAKSRYVTILNVPPGQQIMRMGANSNVVKHGDSVNLTAEIGYVYVDENSPDVSIQSRGMNRVISSWDVSELEHAEISNVHKLSSGANTIVLPISTSFGSFAGRDQQAVSLAIMAHGAANNPGWVARQLSRNSRDMIKSRIRQYFGRVPQYCAIFNNGDSACFEVNTDAPSVERLVQGSQKNADGSLISALEGSGTGTEGLHVRHNPPTIGWSGMNTTGSKGEVWLFCSRVGGVIQNCWVQYLQK